MKLLALALATTALALGACDPDPAPPGGNDMNPPATTGLPLDAAEVRRIVGQHLHRHSDAAILGMNAMVPSDMLDRMELDTTTSTTEQAGLHEDIDELVARGFGDAAIARTEPTRLTYRLTPEVMCRSTTGNLSASCSETYAALSAEIVVTQPASGTLAIVVRTASTSERVLAVELTVDRGEATLDLGQLLAPLTRIWSTALVDGDPAELPTIMSGRLEATWSRRGDRGLDAQVAAAGPIVIERPGRTRIAVTPSTGPLGALGIDGVARTLDLRVDTAAIELGAPFETFGVLVSRTGCGGPDGPACPELTGALLGRASALLVDVTLDAGDDAVVIDRLGWSTTAATLSLDGTPLFSITGRGSPFSGRVQSRTTGVELSSTQDIAIDATVSFASLARQMIAVEPWAAHSVMHLSATGMPSLRLVEMMGVETVARVVNGIFTASVEGGVTVTARAGECFSSMPVAGDHHPFDELAVGPCQ